MRKILVFLMLFAVIGVGLAQPSVVAPVKTGMEIFYETLKSIGLVVLTLVAFTLWKSQGAMLSNEFVWSVFWHDNYRRWLYIFVLLLVLITLQAYFPESIDGITGFMGIQLTAGPGSWATVTVLLMTTIKGVGKSNEQRRKEYKAIKAKVAEVKQ